MKRFIGICFLLSAFFFYGVLVGKYQLFPFYSIQISKHFLEEKFARFFSQSNSGIFNIQCQNNLLSEGSRFLNYQIRLVNKNAPFAARDGAGAVFHEDKLFLIGGWNALDKKNFPKITSNDVWVSHDFGITWKMIKNNSYDATFKQNNLDWQGRHVAGYVSHKDYLYIVGGDASQGFHINDIWRSKDGIEWSLVNSNPPWAPRGLHLTFTYNNYIWVIGGQTIPKSTPNVHYDEIYYRDIWKSKDGFIWEKIKVNTEMFEPRGGYGGSGFILDNEVIIIGGFSKEGIVNLKRNVKKDIWRSKDDLTSWELVGPGPVSSYGEGYQFHDTAQFDNKLWIIGGTTQSKGNTNDIWFSDDAKNWSKVDCSPLTPTHASSVWSTPNGIYISAGNGWTKEVWVIEKKP